ncbi:MAG: CIA30 family protein [Elusimicrobiota bacterium]
MKKIIIAGLMFLLLPVAGYCQDTAIIDNFDDLNLMDTFGGEWKPEDDTPNGGDSYAFIEIIQGRNKSRGALRFDYELGTRYEYRYSMATLVYPGIRNWSEYTGIRFWVKGSGKKMNIAICAKSVQDYDFHVYTINKTPLEWKEYYVPFSAFKQGGWGKQAKLNTALAYKLEIKACSGVDGEEGFVEIDDISLTKETGFSKTITGDKFLYADFEKNTYDRLGNEWAEESDAANQGNSTCEISGVKGQGGSSGALRLDYKLGPAFRFRYAIAKAEFSEPLDLSQYKTMKFWLRGSGAKLKLHVGVADVEDYDYHEYLITTTPAEWKEYKIPFSAFEQEGWGKNKPFNLNAVNKLQFQTGSMAEGEKGWFEVDNISFVSSEESSEGLFKTYPVVNSDSRDDGCYIGIFGATYPENLNALRRTEEKLGKKFSQVMRFLDWRRDFPAKDCENLYSAGYIPHITWEAWSMDDHTAVPLDDILAGKRDAYITKWARDSKAWGKPYMLRWGHEFNGDWYPWSVPKNGPEKYVRAYRYIHDVFEKEGAKNVIWLWSPNNISYPPTPDNTIVKAYPGDEYVDWIAVDGYNFGRQPGFNYGWNSFDTLFAGVYSDVVENIPGKPIMIGEFGCGNVGGDKIAWIRDMGKCLKEKYPAIKAAVWFNINKETDWRIDGQPDIAEAFRDVIKDDYFLTSAKGLLSAPKKIQGRQKSYLEGLKKLNPFWDKKPVAAAKLTSPVDIDGNAGEWARSPVVRITKAGAVEGEVKSNADLSADIYLGWDDSALYIFCDIKDDVPLKNSLKEGELWNGDALELVFGANPEDSPRRVNFTTSDYQLIINPGNGLGKKPYIWNATLRKLAEGSVAVKKKSGGYAVEAAIPFSNFGRFKPQPGKKYGFNFAIDDGDNGEVRESQSVWFGNKEFFRNPSVWNQITFQ